MFEKIIQVIAMPFALLYLLIWGAGRGRRRRREEREPSHLIFEKRRRVVKGVVNPWENYRHLGVPHGVKKIARGAFSSCNAEEIFIPDTVKEIEPYAFEGCGNLKRIRLPEGLRVIPEGCFNKCKSLSEIKFPDSLEVIKREAFGYSGLEKAEFPDKLVSIEACAFNNSKLRSVSFGKGLKKIGSAAFSYCSYLTSVRLPEGISVVEPAAFGYCFYLHDVYIPDSLTACDSEAFRSCDSIMTLRLPKDPESIKLLPPHCILLKRLTVGGLTLDTSHMVRMDNKKYFFPFLLYAAGVMTGFEQLNGDGVKLLDKHCVFDMLFQLEGQGLEGVGEVFAQYSFEAIEYTIQSGAPRLTEKVFFEFGAAPDAEQTDKLIGLAIEHEQNEIYLMLLNYKKNAFGFDDGGTGADDRFEL